MKNLDGILRSLNDKQQKAVTYLNGPSIILAGAGSGKTRVLVSKVLYLLSKGVSPENIVMITFTNKAAGEMKRRIKRNLGFVGTFHAFCVRVLKRDGGYIGVKSNFVIYDTQDKLSLLKKILKNTGIGISPSRVASRISKAKNLLVDSANYLSNFNSYDSQKIAQVFSFYEKELKLNNALDFDDLLFKTVKLLQNNPEIREKWIKEIDYILVDEFQDTNYVQYLLTKILASKSNNLTVVGDFSQSIYSWRGAEITNLMRVQDDFKNAKLFYLDRNYRSTQSILDFAYKVISHNKTHPVLKLSTDNDVGEDVKIKETENEKEETLYVLSKINWLRERGVNYKDMVILYRMNAQSRIFEEAFLELGLPYTLVGGVRFYERKEVKDVLSYLRLVVNPVDEVSKERVIKIGKRRFNAFLNFLSEMENKLINLSPVEVLDNILDVTSYLKLFDKKKEEDYSRLENIEELRSVAMNFSSLSDFLNKVSLLELEYEEKRQPISDSITLMTLHQAKGLEFPYVFIVGVEDGILPHFKSFENSLSLEEERRLFYVGITRAKKFLSISYAKKRFMFGRVLLGGRSRFLDDISSDELLW